MTAALPMGSNKITGMADPSVPTDGATKNYVDTTVVTFFSTGDVKITIKTVADSGWLLFDDGTFGSATSGSSNRANADTQSLFTLVFNNMSDANAPILTSGGGATTRVAQTSAASAWAANCRITLPKTLGRALGIAGTGSGLTGRALGAALGLETATLVTINLPPYTPTVASYNLTVPLSQTNVSGTKNGGEIDNNTPTANAIVGGTITMNAQGGTSTPFSIMQPTVFLNGMIKL